MKHLFLALVALTLNLAIQATAQVQNADDTKAPVIPVGAGDKGFAPDLTPIGAGDKGIARISAEGNYVYLLSNPVFRSLGECHQAIQTWTKVMYSDFYVPTAFFPRLHSPEYYKYGLEDLKCQTAEWETNHLNYQPKILLYQASGRFIVKPTGAGHRPFFEGGKYMMPTLSVDQCSNSELAYAMQRLAINEVHVSVYCKAEEADVFGSTRYKGTVLHVEFSPAHKGGVNEVAEVKNQNDPNHTTTTITTTSTTTTQTAL